MLNPALHPHAPYIKREPSLLSDCSSEDVKPNITRPGAATEYRPMKRKEPDTGLEGSALEYAISIDSDSDSDEEDDAVDLALGGSTAQSRSTEAQETLPHAALDVRERWEEGSKDKPFRFHLKAASEYRQPKTQAMPAYRASTTYALCQTYLDQRDTRASAFSREEKQYHERMKQLLLDEDLIWRQVIDDQVNGPCGQCQSAGVPCIVFAGTPGAEIPDIRAVYMMCKINRKLCSLHTSDLDNDAAFNAHQGVAAAARQGHVTQRPGLFRVPDTVPVPNGTATVKLLVRPEEDRSWQRLHGLCNDATGPGLKRWQYMAKGKEVLNLLRRVDRVSLGVLLSEEPDCRRRSRLDMHSIVQVIRAPDREHQPWRAGKELVTITPCLNCLAIERRDCDIGGARIVELTAAEAAEANRPVVHKKKANTKNRIHSATSSGVRQHAAPCDKAGSATPSLPAICAGPPPARTRANAGAVPRTAGEPFNNARALVTTKNQAASLAQTNIGAGAGADGSDIVKIDEVLEDLTEFLTYVRTRFGIKAGDPDACKGTDIDLYFVLNEADKHMARLRDNSADRTRALELFGRFSRLVSNVENKLAGQGDLEYVDQTKENMGTWKAAMQL